MSANPYVFTRQTDQPEVYYTFENTETGEKGIIRCIPGEDPKLFDGRMEAVHDIITELYAESETVTDPLP
jgi:hypothetical protein